MKIVINHGSYAAYARRDGCRCDRCKAAKRDYTAAKRATAKLPWDDPRHGTRNGYDHWMCRCHACAEAHRAAYKSYYQRVRTGRPVGRPHKVVAA